MARRLPPARVPVLFAVIAASAATVASSPTDFADISGTAGPFTVTLDATTPSEEQSFSATLDAGAALEQGTGEMELSCSFSSDAVGQLRMGITSDTSGDANETDVLDPAAQPSVGISVVAFDGCEGTSACREAFTVRFERLEADVVDALTFEWTVLGTASTIDDGSGEPPSGTLDFDI